MTPREESVWKSIQQKDTITFKSYYKEHYKSFFLMACKYLRDPAIAQEIVNDVFIKLWQDGEKIRIESSLKAYIYRAIINKSLNSLGQHRKLLQHQRELSLHLEEAVEPRQMEENELKARLYEAIDQLPDQCRKVFMMSRFEELKQQEIALRLGISIKTVKNHITYALKRLTLEMGKPEFHIALILIIEDIFYTRH